MSVLKHHTVKIEALSPIFIGSGEKIGKKEYIYLPWDHRVIIPDINKIYTAIQRKGHGRQFEEYMLKNSQDALGVWLKKMGYQKKDYEAWKRYELEAGDAFLTAAARSKEIMAFIKDPYGLPYVPGSSIKGMFRTALLAWEVKKNPPAFGQIKEDIRNNAGRGGRNTVLTRETQQMEEKAFHTLDRGKDIQKKNAVCCNLAGLVVGDSRPVSTEQLVLTQKVDYSLDREEKPLPILREALIPGTDICFDVTIDTSVCPYSMEDILEALEYFQKICYAGFYKRFRRGSNEESVVWLGGGAGFLSKTVLYPVFGAEAYRITNSVFRATLPPKVYEEHKHRKDLDLKLSPHTCKCTRYRGELYDMGMGRIEVLG